MSSVKRPRLVRITLTPKQAQALLDSARIGCFERQHSGRAEHEESQPALDAAIDKLARSIPKAPA